MSELTWRDDKCFVREVEVFRLEPSISYNNACYYVRCSIPSLGSSLESLTGIPFFDKEECIELVEEVFFMWLNKATNPLLSSQVNETAYSPAA